ncbi:uncharacterized protein LOC118647560 [Monomorium pharaonis]|uniref:uncharacterized protein LOC118647560 n=1 Tax=Monomorium pharaonis TaxID=307658 RepID=UPI001746EE2B|nr:uncharacterized protein LOC118647560 [Monomorium pharaonis]
MVSRTPTRPSPRDISIEEGTEMPTTRKRAREQTSESTMSETAVLQAVLQEMRTMREEQARRESEFVVLLRQRKEELSRLRNFQLSPSINRASGDNVLGTAGDTCGNRARTKLGFKLKPDTFDGTVPLREFLSQFLLIARANLWDNASKSVALAASLRGEARTVLESLEDVEVFSFEELKSKLELRFGEGIFTQNSYSLFTNRKQKSGESLAAFGAELERLSRLAYPECPFSVRDKIACSQFISAVSNNFLRRTLQLEGISSLKAAVERAKAIEIIQEANFERKEKFGRNFDRFRRNFEREERKDARSVGGEKSEEGGFRKNWRGLKSAAKDKECWAYGKTGHFRFECPDAKGNAA